MDSTWKDGLEDVVAARTAICQIDGAAGRLYYRGYEIGDLAHAVTFEEVRHLLWFGELPTRDDGLRLRRAASRRRGGFPSPSSPCCAGSRAIATRSTPFALRCRSRRRPTPWFAGTTGRRTSTRRSG